jgi:hypothetical protein
MTAMGGNPEPIAIVIILGVGKLSSVNPDLEPVDLEMWRT